MYPAITITSFITLKNAFDLFFDFCVFIWFNQKYHPYSSSGKTSSGFICSADYAVTSKSNVSETSSSTFAQGYGGQASKSSLEFGEDVPALLHYAVARKKRLRLLSEELLLAQKREVKPSVFALLATP